jgi:acetyl-CoA C-acetyltransferase
MEARVHEVVVVDAVRSAVGRNGGAISAVPATDLLGDVISALLNRNGLRPGIVDRVIGGCVNQIGAQASNVTWHAWLAARLPMEVPAVTVNAQCGSSQEAVTLAHGMIASGQADVVVACGVETMSALPIGSNVPSDPDYGSPRGARYAAVHERTTQFEGAERIAETWDIDRAQLDEFAKASHDKAAAAQAEGRFSDQIVPIYVEDVDDSGRVVGRTRFDRDEGVRSTTLEGLAALEPINPERKPAFHTAATACQISDGASAVLLVSAERAEQLGLRARARLVASVLVGSNPVVMLTGPIPATYALMERRV